MHVVIAVASKKIWLVVAAAVFTPGRKRIPSINNLSSVLQLLLPSNPLSSTSCVAECAYSNENVEHPKVIRHPISKTISAASAEQTRS